MAELRNLGEIGGFEHVGLAYVVGSRLAVGDDEGSLLTLLSADLMDKDYSLVTMMGSETVHWVKSVA